MWKWIQALWENTENLWLFLEYPSLFQFWNSGFIQTCDILAFKFDESQK